MIVLSGEWVAAGVSLGLAFAVAVLGVIGLGYWVLRGDRINRQFEQVEQQIDDRRH